MYLRLGAFSEPVIAHAVFDDAFERLVAAARGPRRGRPGKRLERFPISWTISGVFQIVLAFDRCERVEEVADGVVQGFGGSRRGFAQHMLELGEDLFDRIEVWAIGRQVDELGATSFDGLL